MKLVNNTNDAVVYQITRTNLEHAGTIEPGQKAHEPDFDNQQGVTVNLYSASDNTFNVTVPESKEGMTVTIGIYLE